MTLLLNILRKTVKLIKRVHTSNKVKRVHTCNVSFVAGKPNRQCERSLLHDHPK